MAFEVFPVVNAEFLEQAVDRIVVFGAVQGAVVRFGQKSVLQTQHNALVSAVIETDMSSGNQPGVFVDAGGNVGASDG